MELQGPSLACTHTHTHTFGANAPPLRSTMSSFALHSGQTSSSAKVRLASLCRVLRVYKRSSRRGNFKSDSAHFALHQPIVLPTLKRIKNRSCKLSDPRNRNHKSLAIGNHNFEVAGFSRRNRSKIAVSQSQQSHRAKKIAAIQNHTLVVTTYSGGFPDPCGASETL